MPSVFILNSLVFLDCVHFVFQPGVLDELVFFISKVTLLAPFSLNPLTLLLLVHEVGVAAFLAKLVKPTHYGNRVNAAVELVILPFLEPSTEQHYLGHVEKAVVAPDKRGYLVKLVVVYLVHCPTEL